MMKRTVFSDEELTAYLDGEAPAELAAAIEAARPGDAALRDRIADLSRFTDGLAPAFDRLLAAAPPMPPLPERRVRWRVPAALAASLVLGVGLGLAARGLVARQDGWMDYVASYQALYVPATLSGIAETPELRRTRLGELGAILGRDLTDLPDDTGLSFRRAQLLGFEDRPLVQIAFLSPGGEPVALCIIRLPEGGDDDIRTARREGMAAASWTRDGYGYLLIGGQDDGLIERAARVFDASL